MVPLSALPGTRGLPPATLSLLRLDARAAKPLQQQLLEQLRGAILDQSLRPRQQLPSSRALAAQLGVSRNTVLAVFDQLISEGYLQGSRGSGTYISAELPETFMRPVGRSVPVAPVRAAAVPPPSLVPRPFRPCMPSVAEFPLETWERLRRRVLNRKGSRLLMYCSPAGDEQLREQIALYLRDHRGVRCDPAQVIVTAGAQQAFGLIGRAMARRGQAIWFEDPGYIEARLAFENSGLVIVPQAVDSEGLTVPTWTTGAPQLVYTTPSRQFPLGHTMSLARRMAWLRFAAEHQAWIVEDDYDSEFRYEGRPLPSLQGLLPEARVIYVGTFSKALFPSLRMGYVVAPIERLRAFWEAKETADLHAPAIDQAVVAAFMREGHFVRHLRAMRTLYAERAEVFAEAARKEWRGLVTLDSIGAGLNVAGWVDEDRVERLSEAARARGYEAIPVSRYAVTAKVRPGFFFGFGAYPPALIRRSAHELGRFWRSA